ncbi:hypothetical protein ACFVU3_00560 [Streptomyces sp. NPDC058052]|uniref:hypothetical protein n=1 Tax=Streptomyces sp. NPDC058052 TaxID=3346316 RepID=UPI0036E99FF0
MTFEIRDYYGDHLTARPTAIAQQAGEPPLPAVGIQVENGITLYLPTSRVEEVVAGIRDAARTAARQTTPHACDNCAGIDPASCLTNPDRAARQTTGQDDTGAAFTTVPLSGFQPGRMTMTAPAVGQPAEAHDTEQLVPVGWWCWRGNDHGHLADTACRSDNVPIHVPAEWADEMRAVIQHLTDDHDPGDDCTWVTPEEQDAETLAAADTVEDQR